MCALTACFLGQSALVYLDTPSEESLSGLSLEGARAWHQHNCQACHQLYGYGGFLGPDLTNLAGGLTPAALRSRVEAALTLGPGQMPVIDADSAALSAFLEAMDRTGTGQARVATSGTTFESAVGDALTDASNEVREGWTLTRDGTCRSCHPIFDKGAGDIPPITSVGELDAAELDQVLAEGRPPRMPPTGLTEDERRDLAAFLIWLADQREVLKGAVASPPRLNASDLPWWEHP